MKKTSCGGSRAIKVRKDPSCSAEGQRQDVASVAKYPTPSIEELRATIQADDIVLAYVVRTCKSISKGAGYELELAHTGSGPNIEGGQITLCTCKHMMRTSPVFGEEGSKSSIWIAGFSRSVGGGKNWLFYLMRVGEKFGSQREIYEFLQASPNVLKSKLATTNELGDIFEPMNNCHGEKTKFDPGYYQKPHVKHPHMAEDKWKRDIDYEFNGKKPKMLIGDKQDSYCYPCGKIYLNTERPLGRGYRRMSGSEFLPLLNK